MMTTRVKKRLTVISTVAFGVMIAAGLAAFGLRDSVAFFVTPSELLADDTLQERPVSVGGLVVLGSVGHDQGELIFTLTDDLTTLDVRYGGVVPNLFGEGQCVIAQGMLDELGRLVARRVMAKHDESYTPREIEDAPALARSCGSAKRG